MEWIFSGVELVQRISVRGSYVVMRTIQVINARLYLYLFSIFFKSLLFCETIHYVLNM